MRTRRIDNTRLAAGFALVEVLIAIFILATFITPTVDPVTLLLVAGPMWLFYELSILAARLIERARKRRTAG